MRSYVGVPQCPIIRFMAVILGSARINLGKEEVRCNEQKLFDGVQWVRLPPGKG
jgi:hypothetical protein